MRILVAAALTALLAGFAGPAQAQRPAAEQRPAAQQDRAHRPAVGFLLRHRVELGLTDTQIGRLETIAQRLERENEPLRAQLREAGVPVGPDRRASVREMTPEQRQQLQRLLEENRPTLLRMRANTHAAMEQARGVLTSEQKERMRALMPKRDGDARHRRGGPDARQPRAAGPRPPGGG